MYTYSKSASPGFRVMGTHQAPGSEYLSVNRNRFGFGIYSPGSVRFGARQVRVRFGLVHGRSGSGSVGLAAGGPVLCSGPILIPESNHEARGSGMGEATGMRRG